MKLILIAISVGILIRVLTNKIKLRNCLIASVLVVAFMNTTTRKSVGVLQTGSIGTPQCRMISNNCNACKLNPHTNQCTSISAACAACNLKS